MKLFKKVIFPALSVLALAGAGVAAFAKPNKAPQQASADNNGYTTYFSNELGFATRDPNDTRIVLGDSDGGMQTKGIEVAQKSEFNFTFKKTLDNYWIGVGGYAVYVSSSTTVRFLYLTYNSGGQYSRNIEKNALTMKTYDGSAALTDADGGKMFTNYTKVSIKFDLSDLNAVKIRFKATFNGVDYYPFGRSTRLDEVTYTHKSVNFSDSDKYRTMAGAASNDSGISLLKFESNDVHLDDIIQTPTTSFSYSSIDNFFFTFNLTEKIYANKGYFNDHLTDGTYPNRNGGNINIGDGIIINGQTFNYWRNFTPANASYPRNDGVTVFPLYADNVFNPVAIEVHTQSIEFKINLEEIPMDGIVVTFKSGLFEGYYNGVTYKLENDLTFYSTISTSGGPHRVSFSKAQTWETTSLGFRRLNDNGEHTASQGGKYHRWLMWTNIPFDSDHITQACPADNYRYMYDNLLMNGKPITYYNAWVRGNSKDFADLSDTSTQNPDYELSHPTGHPNTVYDLGIRVEVVTDQSVYAIQFSVPNQLISDLSLGTLTFSLRDGSDWLAKVGNEYKILRYSESANAADRAAVNSFAATSLHMNDYNENLGYCKDNEHGYYLSAKIAFNTLTDEQKVAFKENAEFNNERARYEAWAFANGDAHPYDGNNSISASNVLFPVVAKESSVLIIVIVAITLVGASTALLIIKKRRGNV